MPAAGEGAKEQGGEGGLEGDPLLGDGQALTFVRVPPCFALDIFCRVSSPRVAPLFHAGLPCGRGADTRLPQIISKPFGVREGGPLGGGLSQGHRRGGEEM